MNTIRTILLGLLGLSFTNVGFCQEAALEITLKYREHKSGKGSMRFYYCDLTVTNKQATPIWMVYPEYADDRLPDRGLISISNPEPHPKCLSVDGFEIKDGYSPRDPENTGSFVRVHSFAGQERNKRFNAILLPGGSRFEFAGYGFDAWSEVNAIEIIEARDIVINELTSLVKWCPYDLTASKHVRMKRETRSNDNLDFDKVTFRTRDDLRPEAIKRIEIDIINRRTVPFVGAPPIEPQQDGAGEPATRSGSDTEGDEEPQPQPEGRFR